MLVIACHEMWHVICGIAFGGQLMMFCIDPNLGGFTGFKGPILDSHSGLFLTDGVLYVTEGFALAYLAGYVGSALIGSILVVSDFG